jgi:hypothetical protein
MKLDIEIAESVKKNVEILELIENIGKISKKIKFSDVEYKEINLLKWNIVSMVYKNMKYSNISIDELFQIISRDFIKIT